MDILSDEFGKVDKVNLIANLSNSGYAAGNNLGLRLAYSEGCDKLLVSNSDIIFNQGTIDNIINFYEKNPDVKIVSPKIINNDGSDGTTIISDLNVGDYYYNKLLPTKLVKKRKIKKANVTTNDRDNTINFEGMSSGCCFSMDSHFFNEIDYFDEGTFLYYEEAILARKLKLKKQRTTILENASVIHKHTMTKKNYQTPTGAISVCHSLLYFQAKYHNTPKITLWLIFMPHLFRYIVRSISNKEYRENFNRFIEKCLEVIK